MRDTNANSKRDLGGAERSRSRTFVLLSIAVVTALAAATGGVVATPQQAARDPLTVTIECTDETSAVEIANPNDERAEATLTWDGPDQSAIEVSAVSEPTIETGGETTSLDLATELTAESLTVAVPAAESVTVEGLADGTYEVSAVADGEDVPLEVDDRPGERVDELTVECDAERSADSSGSSDGRSDRSSTAERPIGGTLVVVDGETTVAGSGVTDGRVDDGSADRPGETMADRVLAD